jgi:hypothetical protein
MPLCANSRATPSRKPALSSLTSCGDFDGRLACEPCYNFRHPNPELDADRTSHYRGRDRLCVVVKSVATKELDQSRNLFVACDFVNRLLGKAPMCRIRFVILLTAITATTWSSGQAAGSFQTKPAFPVSHLRCQASRCPTHLRATSLAAAVGAVSAILKHMVVVARPISGKALPI